MKTSFRSFFGKKKTLDPMTVTYPEAFSFFTDRREQYIESASVLSKFVESGDDFIDVGANIGFFSLEFMKKIDFKGHAYLFEPVPNLAKLCSYTFADLPYNVSINPYALGDIDGVATIYTADDGNIGWNTLVSAKVSHGMQKLEIETRRFDSLGIELGSVGAIKIDVEGGEYQVLSGMLPSLEQSTRLPALLVEVGWGGVHPFWEKELDVFSRLAGLGYSTFNPDGTRIDVTYIKETRDVLFIPDRLLALCSVK